MDPPLYLYAKCIKYSEGRKKPFCKYELFETSIINNEESSEEPFDVPIILDIVELGSKPELTDAFISGDTDFYLYFGLGGSVMVGIIGLFGDHGPYSQPIGSEFVSLLSTFTRERKRKLLDNLVTTEGYIKSLPREICPVLSRLTGLSHTVGSIKKSVPDLLGELLALKPDTAVDINCDYSIVSSLSSRSTAMSKSSTMLRESSSRFEPIFNPNEFYISGTSFNFGAVVYGNQVSNMFLAFIDGLKRVCPDRSVNINGLRELLANAYTSIGVFCEKAVENKIRIYETIFREGMKLDLSGKKGVVKAYWDSYRSGKCFAMVFLPAYLAIFSFR
jgi:hypothetical protein